MESRRHTLNYQGWVLKHQEVKKKKVLESSLLGSARGLAVLAAEKGRNKF